LLLVWFCFVFCGTGAWAQGLHLEPFHQPFFVKGFFEMGSRELFPLAGFKLWSSWSLPTESLGLQVWGISASKVLRKSSEQVSRLRSVQSSHLALTNIFLIIVFILILLIKWNFYWHIIT
jgi:hypothetical protein